MTAMRCNDSVARAGPPVHVVGSRPRPADALAPWLRPDELARCADLRLEADRNRFATGRALLRLLVAAWVGRPGADIEFDSRCAVCGRPHGKPRPVLDGGAPFTSVSHAGDRVLVVAGEVPLGVDVEPRSAADFPEFDAVALTLSERAHLAERSAPDSARVDAWVQKEAVLKLHEFGLRREPAQLHLGLSSAARVVPDPLAPGRSLALVGLDAGAGYRAWLATASTAPAVQIVTASELLATAAAPARSATR
jgi:4'-phosphopantetheinyl transferase